MSVATSDHGRRLPAGDGPGGSSPAHGLLVYGTDAELAEAVVARLADALEAGGAAVLLASASHSPVIETGLREAGVDLPAVRLLSLDSGEVLSGVTAGRVPDPTRIRWLVRGLVEHGPPGGGPVACYAELTARLWDQADLAAVLALEGLLDELAASVPELDLLCGYPAAAFAGVGGRGARSGLEDLHATVVETAGRRSLCAEGAPPPRRRTREQHQSVSRPDESDEPVPPGQQREADDRSGGRRHPRKAFLERVREANEALADALREAQSRTQELRDKNRGLRQQVRQLQRRLEAYEAGDDTSAG